MVARIVIDGLARFVPHLAKMLGRHRAAVLLRVALALIAVPLALARLSSQPQQASLSEGDISFRILVVESADEARRILDDLAHGENFVALAQRSSIDPSASSGGLVGPLPVSDLRPELRSVLQGLRVGELSGVVRLPTGFAILKVVPSAEAAAASSFSPSSSGPSIMGSATPALAAG